jgi:hypothetical protein
VTNIAAHWRSFHLFYHADRNLVLQHLVRPVVSSFLAAGLIDSFFFVRFPLGGPHIRLRLRVCPDCEGEISRWLSTAAVDFFSRFPSTQTLAEEAVRQGNEAILAGDPHEDEDAVYPDNSLRSFPLHFEVQRYGGPELLEHSLDFFALSSAQALRFLAEHGQEPWARQLPYVFRLLARQAWGFASQSEELLALLEFPMPAWREPMAPFLAHGDQVFEKRPDFFVRLLAGEIETIPNVLPPAGSPAAAAAAGRGLAWEIRDADPGTRRRIATSQMHMTANRLGLKNREEAYLSRLMWRAGCELLRAQNGSGGGVRQLLAERTAPPPGAGLREALTSALADLGRYGEGGAAA